MRLQSTIPDSQQRGMSNNEDRADLTGKTADWNCNNVNSTHSSSFTSSQNDFIQDNVDYQWFIDYGYRDGSNSLHRSSILSSSCYDDLARDLDANLAHVDMEDFSHEDIHSLLHTLPPICCRDLQDREGEMYASVSGSLLNMSNQDSTSAEDSALSICKSGPLFSPVRECALPPPGTISVDSLDCDEQNIMITCHPNKHNYTIAFQGSTMMTSNTESHEAPSGDENSKSHTTTSIEKPKPKWMSELRGSSEMTNSDSPYTTWSKIKHEPESTQGLSRHPSGNNNSTPIGQQFDEGLQFKPLQSASSVPSLLQSQSLPNLVSNKHQQWLLRNKLLALNSSINAAEKAFDVPIKIFDIEENKNNNLNSKSNSISNSILSDSMFSNQSSIDYQINCNSSNNSNTNFKKHTTTPNHQPNFSLLKLFIKQKTNLDATNINYMSWNNEETVKNINKTKQSCLLNKIRSTNNNNSLDSLNTTANQNAESGLDNSNLNNNNSDEMMSVSQTSPSVSLCNCDDEHEMAESTDSFSSHTNRPITMLQKQQPHEIKYVQDESTQSGISSRVFSEEDFDKKRRALKEQRPFHKRECPMFDKSMQTSCVKNKSDKKQVYVLYPNYTLPDLSFLRDHATELDLNNVFLWPQKFEPSPSCEESPVMPVVQNDKKIKNRPMSCVDIDTLKRRGFSHVRDWNSLIYLLPREYCKILSDVPEVEQFFKEENLEEQPRPIFCTSPTNFTSNKKRPNSCGDSSTSSNAPSSGYRGSSSILNEEGAGVNPLFIYRYDSVSSESSMLQQGPPVLPKRNQSLHPSEEPVPPRPPLPKSILRNPSLESIKTRHSTKRYSMYEFGSKENIDVDCSSVPPANEHSNKRLSLPANAVKKDHGDHCWEDEGVEVGTDTTTSSEHVEDPAQRLELLLEESGSKGDSWQKEDIASLRAQVIKFLSVTNRESRKVSFTQLNNLITPPNSPNNIAANKLYQCKIQSSGISGVPIKEERESSPESKSSKPSVETIHKDLIEAVIHATQHLVNNFSNEQINQTSNIALNNLCPAIYALLNDGLKPNLMTSFGDTPNSVWQVIEASAQLGPSTKSLHELVLKLNSEDVLNEGLLKYNAFIFGLLNVRGLDTWFSFLRTRESILKKHYFENSLILSSSKGNQTSKLLMDNLISNLKHLIHLPFKLDLLYEIRILHESLIQLSKLPVSPVDSNSASLLKTSWTLKKLISSIQSISSTSDSQGVTLVANGPKSRPRSCIDSTNNYMHTDVASSANKRWSTINIGSKLAVAFQSLGAEEDEYLDSLEPELDNKRLNETQSDADENINTSCDVSELPDLNSNSESTNTNTSTVTGGQNSKLGGGKFKRLQQKWEMLSGTPIGTPASSPIKVRSRIPRPVSSPTTVKPSGLPLAKPVAKKPPLPSPTSAVPPIIKRPPSVSTSRIKSSNADLCTLPSKMTVPVRPSRLDTFTPSSKPASRPSSLPYRNVKPTVERRAVSSSVVRTQQTAPLKYVKTLSHRLPSDNGHLSYNSGERLKVVLEVDDKWLLCCRGNQKGLVPRSAVILF